MISQSQKRSRRHSRQPTLLDALTNASQELPRRNLGTRNPSHGVNPPRWHGIFESGAHLPHAQADLRATRRPRIGKLQPLPVQALETSSPLCPNLGRRCGQFVQGLDAQPPGPSQPWTPPRLVRPKFGCQLEPATIFDTVRGASSHPTHSTRCGPYAVHPTPARVPRMTRARGVLRLRRSYTGPRKLYRYLLRRKSSRHGFRNEHSVRPGVGDRTAVRSQIRWDGQCKGETSTI